MKFNRLKLIEGLRKAMIGVEKGNSIFNGDDCFVFDGKRIITLNNTFSTSISIDDVFSEDISGAVRANEMYTVLNKIKDDVCEIDADENNIIINDSVKLCRIDVNKERFIKIVDEIKDVKDDDWVDINDDFKVGINDVIIQNNKSKFEGIYIKDSTIFSTDSFQMNVYDLKKSIPIEMYISNSITQILNENVNKICYKNTWLYFKSDLEIYAMKCLDARRYPYERVKKVIDNASVKNNDIKLESYDAIIPEIELASIFSQNTEKRNLIKLSVKNDKIIIQSVRTSGSFYKEIPWNFDRKINEIDIIVDVDMIIPFIDKNYVLNILVDGPSKLLFTTEHSKHLMVTFSGENYQG